MSQQAWILKHSLGTVLILQLKQGSSFKDLQTSNVHVKAHFHTQINLSWPRSSVHTDPESRQQLFMRSVICCYSAVINTITPLQSKIIMYLRANRNKQQDTETAEQRCMYLKLQEHGGSSTFPFLTHNNTQQHNASFCCLSVVETQLGHLTYMNLPCIISFSVSVRINNAVR